MAAHTISLILDNIRSTYNVGSIFRTADCFGVKHIFIAGYTPYPKHALDSRLPHEASKIHHQIVKTALGAEQSIPFSVHPSVADAITAAKQRNYRVAAVEQDTQSVTIHSFTSSARIALLLGNEVEGLSISTKKLCDDILEIEQYGQKESLNVANACAIALYACRTQ